MWCLQVNYNYILEDTDSNSIRYSRTVSARELGTSFASKIMIQLRLRGIFPLMGRCANSMNQRYKVRLLLCGSNNSLFDVFNVLGH